MTDTRELVERLRHEQEDPVYCRKAADAITDLEKRLAGLHESHAKVVETANAEFHRAERLQAENTALSERVRVLEEEKATLREAILREAAAICKRIRLQSDLSEDERVGVLECALALTDEANVARAALAGKGEA